MDRELRDCLLEYEEEKRQAERFAAFTRRLADRGVDVEDYFRVRRARRRADAIGLAYWPALAHGPRIDPRAYLAAERILTKKAGARYGEPTSDGRKSRGGWDSWGHRGVSPHMVYAMWMAAGCRNSRKFRAQVAVGRVAHKGERAAQFIDRARGYGWAEKNKIDLRLGHDAARALGRISWRLRWAAINGVRNPDDGFVRARDLNWTAVREAQRGSRAAAKYLPHGAKIAAWVESVPGLRFEPLKNALPLQGVVWPHQCKLATVRKLLAHEQDKEACLLPVLNLVRLFGADEQAIRRFAGARSLHDAGQFVLPDGGFDAGTWGQLVLRAPTAIKYISLAAEIEAHLGRPPRSRREVEEAAIATGAMALGELALMSAKERGDYERLYASGRKAFVGIPAPLGVEAGEYSLRQLDAHDKLQPLAGRLVNCCQHLHGAAASCAMSAWTEGDAAIWAVWRDGQMVAQAYVWRSDDGEDIVIDSVECLKGHEDAVAPIFAAAAKSAVGRLGVRRALVGTSHYGATRQVVAMATGERFTRPECRFLRYTDAGTVVVLAKSALPQGSKLIAADHDCAAPQAINELLEGSGVVCEFCGAEVHPDCEICPSCGQNIAEWV